MRREMRRRSPPAVTARSSATPQPDDLLLRHLRCFHHGAGADAQQIACHHQFSGGDAFPDGDQGAVLRPQGYVALLDLVVFADDVKILAELARAYGRLRYEKRVRLVGDMQAHADELAG